MENFKLATQQKLRFNTSKGVLSTEQLWELSLTDLDSLAVTMEEEYAKSGKKSFLVAKSVKDKTTKLKFDVILDILTTKVEEAEIERTKREDKEHNQKILALIEEKQEDGLKKKSVKELEKMLR